MTSLGDQIVTFVFAVIPLTAGVIIILCTIAWLVKGIKHGHRL